MKAFSPVAALLALALPAAAQQTITDSLGVGVTVPADPQRIAILDPLAALEASLLLGVVPVQTGHRSFVKEWTGDPLRLFDWQEARLRELGADPMRVNADETNVEAVATADPDLIIGSEYWVEGVRDQLNQIAPTVAVGDVREAVTLLGAGVGQQDRAQEVLADWDALIANELAGLAPEGATYAVIRTDEPGLFTIFADSAYGPVSFFADAGFALAPDIADLPPNPDGYGATVSLERVDLLAGADLIVMLGFSPEPTADLLATPIFQTLPAVAAGRVLVVEQGPVAQAFAILSPLNFDTVLPLAQQAAALVTDDTE